MTIGVQSAAQSMDPHFVDRGSRSICGCGDPTAASSTAAVMALSAVYGGSYDASDCIGTMDFKTDRPLVEGDANWATSRADHHRPQLQAYREAVAAEYGVDPQCISISIILLATGEVVLL